MCVEARPRHRLAVQPDSEEPPEGFSQFGEDLNIGLRKQLAGHLGAIAIKQEVIEADRNAGNAREVF